MPQINSEPPLDEKRQRLLSLLERSPRAVLSPAAKAVAARAGRRVAPLTDSQLSMWIIHQLEPSKGVYNIPIIRRLRGDLRLDLLVKALQEVVRIHEILRVRFVDRRGTVEQEVVDFCRLEVELKEVRCDPDENLPPDFGALVSERTSTPFDLNHPPLLRASVFQIGPKDHVMLIVAHHIVFDLWSSAILLRETSRIYNALLKENAASPKRSGFGFLDYVYWLNATEQQAEQASQLTFWRKFLWDAPPASGFPPDFPRPARHSFRGASYEKEYPAETQRKLRRFCQIKGVTPFMALFSAFAVFLFYSTGQKDLCLGSVMANRPFPEAESIVGFLGNTVVFRSRLTDEASFTENLLSNRQMVLDVFGNSGIAFEKLVHELLPQRSPGLLPIFQTFFVLQNVPPAKCTFEGTESKTESFATRTSKYDTSWFLFDNENGLRALIEYCTDLFSPETMTFLADRYGQILDLCLVNPDLPIKDLRVHLKEMRGIDSPL